MSEVNDPLAFSVVDVQDKVSFVLDLANQAGVDSAEVSLSFDRGFSVTTRNGDVETLEHQREKGVELTVYMDSCEGSVSTSDFSESALRAMVDKACVIAKYTEVDESAGIADRDLLSNDVQELQLYSPWNTTPQAAISIAVDMDNTMRRYDTRIVQVEEVSVSTCESLYLYANTHGFLGHYLGTEHSYCASAVAQENDKKQTDYAYTIARSADSLMDSQRIAIQACDASLAKLGSRKIPTQKCPVVFSAKMACGLIGSFVRAASGSSIYNKSSFLLDKLGKQIFPSHISIYQRPHLFGAMGSAPFDADGILTKDMDYVSSGCFENYFLSVYSARRLDMRTTGNAGGVYNLQVSHSDMDLPALLRQMDTGFFVTGLMGQGVNIMTGEYSRGASGFWVEGGEIQFPVDEVTIAGQLHAMFLNIVAVANDVDLRRSIQSGALLIEEMIIAGE